MSQIQFKKILSPSFLLIFLAVLVSTLVDQTLNKQIELIIRSTEGLSNMIWVWGASSLLSSLLFPLLISMLCSYTLSNFFKSPLQMLSEKLELSFIETLRAWGKVFLWCFLFVIPGLVKYSSYIMAPFVVLFSKKYAKGEADALQLSAQVTQKFWWTLNLWLAVFYLAIPLLISSTLDEYRLFTTHPLTATLSVLLDSFLVFTFHFLILKKFIKNLNEVENGSYV